LDTAVVEDTFLMGPLDRSKGRLVAILDAAPGECNRSAAE
jgi:hypothetical protein